METEQILRGSMGRKFEVFEENDSARVSFAWREGESYLLFLKRAPDGTVWFADGCGNSAPLSEAAKTLRVIESLPRKQNSGLIQEVVLSSRGALGVPSEIRIEVRGEGHVYSTEADRYGQLKIRVPPGEYEARAFHQGWNIVFDTLTFEESKTPQPEKARLRADPIRSRRSKEHAVAWAPSLPS